MPKILCVGVATVDFLFRLDALPDRGRKYGTENAEIVGGGGAANAAVAIARLGGTAFLGEGLGDDPIGDMILDGLAAEGVELSAVTRTPGARSPYSAVSIDPRGERQIVNFRGAGLVVDTDRFATIPGLDAVLTDTRRRDAALAALTLARSRGIPGIVDGEEPVDPAILDAASHVGFSMQGLRSVLPDGPPQDALASLAARHRVWAAVTDGAQGAWYTDGNASGGVVHCPAPQVKAVDTLGAGDVWHGAFALALAEGQTPPDAVRFANAAAALKCTVPGGRTGSPDRAAVAAYLAAGPG